MEKVAGRVPWGGIFSGGRKRICTLTAAAGYRAYEDRHAEGGSMEARHVQHRTEADRVDQLGLVMILRRQAQLRDAHENALDGRCRDGVR